MIRATLCLLLLAFAACGGGDAPASTTPSTGEPSAADQPASSDQPAPPAEALGCDKEVALSCADGFIDGCLAKLTLVHACVAVSEEKAGAPPCATEIARQCPAGQVDACSTTPPQSANHVCVVAGK
jgi:hypothetical protein